MFDEFDVLEGQMSLFEQPIFKIDKPIRLIELFAGIGSQAKALENLNANFEHYRVCEFNEYAIKSYNAVHHTNFEISDITLLKGQDLQIVDTDKFIYIVTYSFPCQDLSIAGRQKGMMKGQKTRSGLLWEVERLLNECEELPQVLLMENVPQVHSEQNIKDFRKWIEFLESKGYSNFYKDLNSKNFGIPQNRNRCFMVSIKGNFDYIFPKQIKERKLLVDMLETDVDDKFYIKDVEIRTDGSKALIPQATKKSFIECEFGGLIDLSFPDSKTKRGRVQDNGLTSPTITVSSIGGIHKIEPINADDEGLCRTIKEQYAKTAAANFKYTSTFGATGVTDGVRLRKLTSKECWRLMGFTDQDYENASKVNSNAQLYKQAGNSIVVNVLEAIFKQMM